MSTKWEELPVQVLETMKFLGDFGPLIDHRRKEVKGYMHDADGGGKVYLSAKDLRNMADDFYKVADWLEDRAVQEGDKP